MNFQNKSREELLQLIEELQIENDSLKSASEKKYAVQAPSEKPFSLRCQNDLSFFDATGDLDAHTDTEGRERSRMTSRNIPECNLADDKLKENERRLREAQELAHLGYWYWNVKTGEVEWSEEVFKIFGLDSKEFIPRIDSILAFSPWPEYHQRDQELINKATESHATGSYEQKFIRPDSTIGYYYSTFQGKYDEKGALVTIVGTVLDISERKIVEEKLLASEEKYKQLFENSPVGKSMTGIDGSLKVNNAFCDIIGYSKEELKTMSWMDITYEEDIANTNKYRQYLLDGELSSASFEKRYVHKNGNIIWAYVSIYLQRDKQGNPDFFITTVIDFTQRKYYEERIKILSLAVEQSPSSIIITNAKGEIEFVNDKFQSFMQYSLDDVKGKKPRIFNPEHLSPEMYDAMWQILRNGNIWQGEFKNRKKDKTELWEDVIISPLSREDGSINNYILIMVDITEKKKMVDDLISAKEKAEESDRLKTAFLNNISHEIRTPMNAIMGFSGLLNDPGLDFKERERFIDIINKSSNQLLSVITDIISLASIEAGQEKISENIIDIDSILIQLNQVFQSRSEKQNVRLNLEPFLGPNENTIITDGVKLTQILTNLLDNAVKFTKQGVVNFGYTVKGSEVEFFVEDTGIGISPDMHEEIFKHFRQVETTTARNYGGSGIGLSIAKAYVELLGGKIWLSSQLNEGSTFYFTIPNKKVISNSALKLPLLNGNKVEIKQSKTLLIAEDEEMNFMLLEVFLTGLNIIIIRAENGREAVEICKMNTKIDLVLMDLKMPIMDGYEATKQIKEFLPDIPIIAQTAYSKEEDKNKALASGCIDFLSKPIKKELLISKINEHLCKA